MKTHLTIRVAALALGCAVVASHASAGRSAVGVQPAEYPPSGFSASQYVDSTGCVFVRTGFGQSVNWVPRMDRQRNQICGFQPSLPGATGPAAPHAVNAPVIEVAQPASRPPAPQIIAPAVAAPAAPRVVEAPAPRVMSRAEACAGRTGIQAGIVHSRTGAPLDCGGSAVPVAPVQVTQVASSGSACLAAIAQGRFSISGSGGEMIRCAPQAEPITGVATARIAAPTGAQAAPVAGRAPVVGGRVSGGTGLAQISSCLQAIQSGQGFYISGDGREVRCAPQAERPWTPGLTQGGASSYAPQSYGTHAAAPVLEQHRLSWEAPQGHQPIFDDGRLNLHRGVARLQVASR